MNKIKPITPAQWADVCEFNKDDNASVFIGLNGAIPRDV